MKEQIIAILEKYGLIDENYPNVVREFEKLCQNDIDLAYCAGIFNTGGVDVLSKELERLKHIGRKPHQIFQRYKQATNLIAKVKEANTFDKRSFEEAEADKKQNNCNNCKWGICLTKDWPCNDCNGSSKWEPIKTE